MQIVDRRVPTFVRTINALNGFRLLKNHQDNDLNNSSSLEIVTWVDAILLMTHSEEPFFREMV